MKKLGTLLVLFLSVIALVACASGKKDAASGPVSYTHLDVYKRQF